MEAVMAIFWVEWGAAGSSGEIAPCFARKVDEELQAAKQVDFDAIEVSISLGQRQDRRAGVSPPCL
jgi:hypothetical protein